MEDIHARVLDKGIAALTKDLDPDTVVSFLISKGVLEINDSEKIQAKETRAEKVLCLICILKTRGQNAYKIFIQSLEQHDFNKHLAETLRHHENTTSIEDSTRTVKTLDGGNRDMFRIPSDEESDDEEDIKQGQVTINFKAFLEHIGLKGKFPGQLSLKRFENIKDPCTFSTTADLVELFWHKLSSFDYRARSKKFLKQNKRFSLEQISIKDFVFAVLQCSDRFLRQGILEKMSACQLAVPLILQGIEGRRPELLSWSLRQIVKKWKDEGLNVHEKHIVRVPLYSVSFLRIGGLKGISKSGILNYLLGQCQGNRSHSYFLTKEDDQCCCTFSQGCVECIWYLPENSNDSEQFKDAMAVYNLRGDSAKFPHQTKFLCRASNLTIAFVADRNKHEEDYAAVIDMINFTAKQCKFIIIDDERDPFLTKTKKMKLINNCLYVRRYEIGDLCEYICELINKAKYNERVPASNLRSIDDLEELCEPHIEAENAHETCENARKHVLEILDLKQTNDVIMYKEKSFPLQRLWNDWVAIDKVHVRPDGEKEISVEYAHEEISSKKDEKRKMQVSCGLSKTAKSFQGTLDSMQENAKLFGHFMCYFQEDLFELTYENTKINLQTIEKLEKKCENLEEVIKATRSTERYDKTMDEKIGREQTDLQREIEECKQLCKEESEKCKNKTLGWEYFLRELGQFYEAHVELNVKKDSKVALTPFLAVRLLASGYSLEIMDGDTGRIPLTWVKSVLRAVAGELKNPSILVLSVVGVQSSGKSTLLNTMFGLRFPVRAGRCTRGLFLRMLKVEECYAKKLGAKYIFIIDSEGIRSLERAEKFDKELVTLALCISDITILNIEGEVISTEMAGILEIAAHALMRMKQVDLTSQCRIIQQKVSDLTASDRNKVNMNQIVETLNKATITAANVEGFSDRYQQFSDIFVLRRDKDLQFIPCLWTQAMSPPNALYSHYVTKVKEDILTDVTSGKVIPQFTVVTFMKRVQDVWVAVKDESFLFNFQDSVKAVDFTILCMEINKWITSLRRTLIGKQLDWQRRLLERSNAEPDDEYESIKKECCDDLHYQKASIEDEFDSFVANHERKDTIKTYSRWFKQNLEFTVTDIKHYTLSILSYDVARIRFKNHITSSLADIRIKLREDVNRLVSELHTEEEMGNQLKEIDLDKAFETNWKEWVQKRQHEFVTPNMSEKAMEVMCETLLHSCTKDMSVSPEIDILSKEEGGIRKHADKDVAWEEYYPSKGGNVNVEDWFRNNKGKLQLVADNSIKEMIDKGSEKQFDTNLFQYILQNAFQQLSPPNLTSEAPCRLKAKVLLHVCGLLFENALQNQRAFEAKHTIEKLVDNEKKVLRDHFTAFVKRTSGNEEDNAVNCLIRYLTESGTKTAIAVMRRQVINRIMKENLWGDKFALNINILMELCTGENFESFCGYISNHTQYIHNWISLQVEKICCENIKGQLFLELIANKITDELASHLQSVIDNSLSEVKGQYQSDPSSMYKDWVDCFVRLLLGTGFIIRFHELGTELRDFRIANLDQFLVHLKSKLNASWKDNVLKEIQVPVPSSPQQMKTFLKHKVLINSISSQAFTEICLEQCPLCKATCDHPSPLGRFHTHAASTHLPRGMMGVQYPTSSQLVIEDCTMCTSSSTAAYVVPGTNERRLCKEYKTDFPNWVITPQEQEAKYSFLWKWAMTKFNKSLSNKYKCKPAEIPPRWRNISKQDALDSLLSAKQLHNPFELFTQSFMIENTLPGT